MLPQLPLTATALPWLVVAWIATLVVVSMLVYLIARAVLGKTDPQKLPEVLRALTPLLHGLAWAELAKLLATPLTREMPPPSTPMAQPEGASTELPEEAA